MRPNLTRKRSCKLCPSYDHAEPGRDEEHAAVGRELPQRLLLGERVVVDRPAEDRHPAHHQCTRLKRRGKSRGVSLKSKPTGNPKTKLEARLWVHEVPIPCLGLPRHTYFTSTFTRDAGRLRKPITCTHQHRFSGEGNGEESDGVDEMVEVGGVVDLLHVCLIGGERCKKRK